MFQVTWVSKIHLHTIETDMYVDSMSKRWKLAVGEDQVENEVVARAYTRPRYPFECRASGTRGNATDVGEQARPVVEA